MVSSDGPVRLDQVAVIGWPWLVRQVLRDRWGDLWRRLDEPVEPEAVITWEEAAASA